MVAGLFNTVELLNIQLAHKIDVQGLCVIHCEPTQHYISAENMDNVIMIEILKFRTSNMQVQIAWNIKNSIRTP